MYRKSARSKYRYLKLVKTVSTSRMLRELLRPCFACTTYEPQVSRSPMVHWYSVALIRPSRKVETMVVGKMVGVVGRLSTLASRAQPRAVYLTFASHSHKLVACALVTAVFCLVALYPVHSFNPKPCAPSLLSSPSPPQGLPSPFLSLRLPRTGCLPRTTTPSLGPRLAPTGATSPLCS